MKQFKFILICMAVIVTLNAKHEGTFTVENIEKSGDFFEIDTLTVKYSVGFLMGEMVLDANAKYSLGNYITVDGTIHRMNEFPDEVKNRLKLTELKVQVGVVSGLALPNMNVSIDLGAMGKPNTWSYNTSSSPNWDKFIYNGIHEVPMYFDKEKTIKVMKEFKRFGLGEHLSNARAVSIGYDVSAVRDFLIKQKKDKAKKAEEKLKEAEEKVKETKGEKQDTAIADVVKSKEKVITVNKDLLAELERKESAEYKKRIEKENKDALDELFSALEDMEKENYDKRIKKKQVVSVTQSKKSSVNAGKSGKAWYDQIEIQNTKWSIHYSHKDEEGTMTIGNNNVSVQYMYNGKKDLLWKYTILNNPKKNCWIMSGQKYFKDGKAYGKIKYYLMYDVFGKKAVIVPYSVGYEKAEEFAKEPANYYFELKP